MNVYDKKVIFSYFTGFSISTLCMNFFLFFQAFKKAKTFKGRSLKVSMYRPLVTPTSPAKAVPSIPTALTVLKKVEDELGLDIDVELIRTQRGVQLTLS